MTNIALDLIGHSRALLQYAAKVEGKGKTEDDLASFRDIREFKNLLLVEQPNGNFANTVARHFLFDTYNYHFFDALQNSKDEELAAIAKKAIKEIAYHYRFSAEWVIRLGDGTDESYEKMQDALEDAWVYTEEIFEMDAIDEMMLEAGIGVDLDQVKVLWKERVDRVLKEGMLSEPKVAWMQKGGKKGDHTEQMGFIPIFIQHI